VNNIERKAAEAGGSLKLDLDDREGSFGWCIIMVKPAVIEKLQEIAGRTGETPDQVLVRSILEYEDRTTKEDRGE